MKRTLIVFSLLASLTGCAATYTTPSNVVYVAPVYPPPVVYYSWSYHPHFGWGYHHHHRYRRY